MLINGVQLSALGAQLYNRVLTSNDVETTHDWLEGDIQPTFVRQQDKFKSMELQFLITEKNEEDAFIVMSNIAMLLKKAVIIFDDMDLQFDVVMEGAATQNRLKNGNFIYTVKLKSDYAKGTDEIHTTNTDATNSFKLSVLYYKDTTTLISTDTITIKAVDFAGDEPMTWQKLGVNVNKYQEEHYNEGKITNFTGVSLTYENLYNTGVIIVNYTPTVYAKNVEYYLNTGKSYELIEATVVNFTYADVINATSLGQIIDFNKNRPTGYSATTKFNLEFTFDNLMSFPLAIGIYYDIIENERSKDVVINYYGGEILISSQTINIREGRVVEGATFASLFNVDGYKPGKYYTNGQCAEVSNDSIVTFDTLLPSYTIRYEIQKTTLYVEYYKGEYPSWVRITTDVHEISYNPAYEESENIIADLGINLDKYLSDAYNIGQIFNKDSYNTYDDVANIGVIQVFYKPKEYTVKVKYVQDPDDGTTTIELGTKDFILTDVMFLAEPKLAEIIDLNAMRPSGYVFNADSSYGGEVSLSGLTAASPITVTYTPAATIQTKSIIIKYKKELTSTYSVINTAIVTIEQAAVGAGIKVKNLFDINKYRPEFYNEGIVDGLSSEALLTFEEINGTYEVYYLASSYTTQIRYYTDEIANENWIGSSNVSYTVLSFTADTTLTNLGVNINLFKPSYCKDGDVQYFGPVNFTTLRNLDAINIVYESVEEPGDDTGIDYPHRILFLQHNDMGQYESNFNSWTLNHAYINTGVTVEDMSKLTVACSTFRVFEDQPLYEVNVGNAYLFGSMTANGSYFLRYENNTKYCDRPTGVNYFSAAAGYGTPVLQIEENSSNGFSRNTGIFASDRDGYSYATLTYSNLVQSNSAPMRVPLFLFACDYNGYYNGGIAGVGIVSCKIYYDDVLIRDFIPVAFYDKIGTQVAPSNCLYDKVSQTFFEDATGLNSFNIIDDPDYDDHNPEHNIGKCYCNYYKGGEFFQTRVIYFRESDFVNGNVWDPEIALGIDEYQPQFFGAGVITNIDELPGLTFNNVKDFVFKVNYPSTGYYVTVNYYKDSATTGSFLGTEDIYLTDRMFYGVPTFGELIPLNKYQPAGGYKAVIPYTDSKVTLQRLLQQAPYNIVYEKITNPQQYSFTVKYYKHKKWIDPRNPINEYQFLGNAVITIDETQIIDGVYPENFIDFNLYKPQGQNAYWEDGAPFEWYLKDNNLIDPSKLADEYIVTYEPKSVFVNINYYTDDVDDDNMIASSTWEVKINDWEFDETFKIVDELPNNYVNKYKPNNCFPGVLQQANETFDFDTLAKTTLEVVYVTKDEPHNPEDDSFPSKVIWYKPDGPKLQEIENVQGNVRLDSNSDYWPYHNGYGHTNIPIGPYIPYLDLGYTPKEIGRLKFETKAYSVAAAAIEDGHGQAYAPQFEDYTYFLGYVGAVDPAEYRKVIGYDDGVQKLADASVGMEDKFFSYNSSNSTGWMAIRGHVPYASGYSKQFSDGPATIDGVSAFMWNNTAQAMTITQAAYYEVTKSIHGGFRLGKYSALDEDLERYIENNDHEYFCQNRALNSYKRYGTDDTWSHIESHSSVSWSNGYQKIWDIPTTRYGAKPTWDDNSWNELHPAAAFHPYTMTVDAYNNYVEIYDNSNSNDPLYWNVDTTKDYDLFLDRCKPNGPITLFLTTNPDTGKLNVMSSSFRVHGWKKHYKTKINDTTTGDGNSGNGNNQVPGNTPDAGGSGTGSQTGGSGGSQTGGSGSQIEIHGALLEMAYNPYVTEMDCPWASVMYDPFPVPMRTMIWYVKIWDRDKLVRHLIPVAKGDQIYDYVMPANGMFDLVTEIFFGNANQGGTYKCHTADLSTGYDINVKADEVFTLRVDDDPTVYGKIPVNYYDENDNFIGNQYAVIPTDYFPENISFKDILKYNDMKPSIYYHDGIIDTDVNIEADIPDRSHLKEIFDSGVVNVYYKQKQYAKTVVYYAENTKIASKDFFFSQAEIEAANSLADLGIDPSLYQTPEFKPGVVMSDETIIAGDDVAAFINAPSPVVVYKKWSKTERPDLFYYEYYRGGAYEVEGEESIVLNSDNKNYLDCNLTATVLNPKGAIKYVDHYHSALYEDEEMPYFLAYQVDVVANYAPLYKGPARSYSLLGQIVDKGRYTVIEENRGWGRLKEYPKGWILLKYTEPVTGPGENPDYDTPDDKTVNITVPFGTKITVSKMTIDRLWAYSPEFASWIKTEEISFDQSGRLYNALAMGVIKLNELDWSNISSLEDMGIDINKYLLRYHDECAYRYDGAFTQAALADLHSIDLVYNETIYPYVVNYYKDTIDDSNIIGTGSFSCSLSDWNPDWDTFLSTSWQKDEQGHEILPTLYRSGEPIMLTWDFYGLDANLYKPDSSYNDGFFLWNPHSYESTVRFSFEEIITTGNQKVLYTPVMDTKFKARFDAGWIKLPMDIENFYFVPTNEEPGVYDIEMKYQVIESANPYSSSNDITNNDYQVYNLFNGMKYANMLFTTAEIKPTRVSDYGTDIGANGIEGISNRTVSWYSEADRRKVAYVFDTYTSAYNASAQDLIYYQSQYLEGSKIGEQYNIVNISNKRPYKQAIAVIAGNDVSKWEAEKPVFIARSTVRHNDNEQSYDFDTAFSTDHLNIGSGVYARRDLGQIELHSAVTSIFYHVKVWKNFYLEHYYVPVPKGYWLPNGTQMLENSFYDLITQTSCGLVEGINNISQSIGSQSQRKEQKYPDILKLGEAADANNIDYFETWDYETTEVDFTVKTLATTKFYKHPDRLSQVMISRSAGMHIPVRKSTADAANNVLGTWYYTGKYWISAEDVTLDCTQYAVEKYKKTCGLKGDTSNVSATYLGWEAPAVAAQTQSTLNTFTTEQTDTIFYVHTNEDGDSFYWNGSLWISAAYTDDFTIEYNKTYIVAVNEMQAYTYPIANAEFLARTYLAGDRINVEYKLGKDEKWYKLNNGVWLFNNETMTELE